MRIRIAQETVTALLARAQSVIERKTTRPILENILLECYDGRVRVSATDLRVSLSQEAPCEVETPGSISLPGRKLHEIVRELPKGEIVLELMENQWVTVAAGKGLFHLPSAPADEYPSIPTPPEQQQHLSADVFRAMVEKTLFAASSDESRPYLTGVFMKEWKDERETPLLRMVATDGHRLSVVDRELQQSLGAFQEGIIVPKKGLAELKSLLEGVDGDFAFAVHEGRFYAQVARCTLFISLIDAAYPNYEQVIPSSVKAWVYLNRTQFQTALRRVALLSDDETRSVLLEAKPGLVVLSSDNPMLGDAREEIEVSYDGPQSKLAFNAQYFSDVLKVLEGEDVAIGMSEALAPCLVKSPTDLRYLSVVMPMRID